MFSAMNFLLVRQEALYISALLAKVIAKLMAMNIVNIVPHYIVNIINEKHKVRTLAAL